MYAAPSARWSSRRRCSRFGADRVLRYAFELARSRPRKQPTVATKSNGIADQRACRGGTRTDAMAQAYPDIGWTSSTSTSLSARFVLQPQRFDVVAATNLFGDILSDLGPATTGTIGLAPSANLNPRSASSRRCSSRCTARRRYLRPEHRQPDRHDLVRRADARLPGERAAHDAILRAIERVLVDGPHTADLGGKASTTAVGQAIAALDLSLRAARRFAVFLGP